MYRVPTSYYSMPCHTLIYTMHACILITATCSRDPPSPTGGSVNSTNHIEGSVAIFQCDTGLVPDELLAAVCTTSGKWVPNPGDLSCSQPREGTL